MNSLEKYDERIPAWDLSKLFARPCPFCGNPSNQEKYLRPDGLRVVLCNFCDTHFVSPSPSENQIDDFYESYYVHHAHKVTGNQNFLKKLLISHVYDDVRVNVLSALRDITGLQVLDVGCGNGEFLLKLEFLGAYVTGIDLSLDAVNEAHKSGLRNVFKVPFSEYNDGIKYDLIVLNDVIEHPLEPLKLIEKANSLLKPGGMLLIWTPNNDNIFLDVEKKTLRVDLEHMQYLGSKACKQLSLAHNFEIVHYESLGGCTYSPSNERNLTKKFLIIFLKIFFLYPIIRRIYKLFKFKHDRRGNYHLFTIFKKS